MRGGKGLVVVSLREEQIGRFEVRQFNMRRYPGAFLEAGQGFLGPPSYDHASPQTQSRQTVFRIGLGRILIGLLSFRVSLQAKVGVALLPELFAPPTGASYNENPCEHGNRDASKREMRPGAVHFLSFHPRGWFRAE